MTTEDDILEDADELETIHRILTAFQLYSNVMHRQNDARRQNFESLSERHQNALPGYPEKLDRIDKAIDANSKYLRAISEDGAGAFLQGRERVLKKPTSLDLSIVKSHFKQVLREWSSEGKESRDAAHMKILAEIEKHSEKLDLNDKKRYKVLVPGAGLGRLVFDIAQEGYHCEGNEFSYNMLMSSNFMLNYAQKEEEFTIYPYIHSLSNHESNETLVRAIKVPDVSPTNIALNENRNDIKKPKYRMSMTAGDFNEIYASESSKESFHAIATCYFIDTAVNVLEYIDTIYNCLKTNGIWINYGPLLYEFETQFPSEDGIRQDHVIGISELSLNELIMAVERLGFNVEFLRLLVTSLIYYWEQEVHLEQNNYAFDSESMLQQSYICAYWVAHKKSDPNYCKTVE